MKIKHYNDAIDWLTRPKFNGGGSVKNKEVLPKRKPEEELKKRKKKRFEKLKEYLENPEEVERMLEFQFGGGVEGQLKGSAAAKKAAMEKQPDRIRPSFYDGKLNIKGPKDQIKKYLKDLEKRFEFPITSQDYLKGIKDGSILSNEALAKKYKVNLADVERINRVLKRDNKLEYKKQTLEGEKKRQRERDVRRKADIKKVSSPAMEQKIKREIKKVDPKALAKEVDVAHRASLKANSAVGADYLTTSLGIDKKIVNQELVKPTEQKLGTLYKNQQKLIKGLKPGEVPKQTQKEIEKINKKISELSDRTKGALQGVLIDEKTLKPSIYGVDYKKVLGAGLVDKPVKDLTKTDLDLIKLQIPEQIKAAKRLGTKEVTQLNAKLPIISTMYDVAKSIPDDVGKAKYLSAGFKTLGLAVAPYVAYTTYQDVMAGKNLVEALERNLIGTDIIGGTKDILAMSPEERKARAKVKQEQTAELNIDMPTGFGFIEAPPVQTDMSLEEARQKFEAGKQRVAKERAETEAGVAAMRKQAFDNLKDTVTGNREMAVELAGGGLLKQAGKRSGPPPEKGPGGLASLEDYARTMME